MARTKRRHPGGRPPRDSSGPAADLLKIRVTEVELARYQQAAYEAGERPVSEWARQVLDAAASRKAS